MLQLFYISLYTYLYTNMSWFEPCTSHPTWPRFSQQMRMERRHKFFSRTVLATNLPLDQILPLVQHSP
jgi:hypothetical protein